MWFSVVGDAEKVWLRCYYSPWYQSFWASWCSNPDSLFYPVLCEVGCEVGSTANGRFSPSEVPLGTCLARFIWAECEVFCYAILATKLWGLCGGGDGEGGGMLFDPAVRW